MSLKSIIRTSILGLAVVGAAVAAVTTGAGTAAAQAPCPPGQQCFNFEVGRGAALVAVWLQPQQSAYWAGDFIELCAETRTAGTLTFSNRRYGRIYDLGVTIQAQGGRIYCIEGYVERGDENLGATLTLRNGSRSSADPVWFRVR